MCGEHGKTRTAQYRHWGSSPHVRGAPSTPAPRRTTSRDHPRMCGEHASNRLDGFAKTGSSPHVRGALAALRVKPVKTGDHPRMCGEHLVLQRNALELQGSSPHVRGAQPVRVLALCARGIIPACAGSTFGAFLLRYAVGDHPRMCGEHGHVGPRRTLHLGSSPHVRGARAGPVELGAVKGIIPACAGSTSSSAAPAPARRDHPRMCGEHPRPNRRACRLRGSSPHVRGAHGQRRPEVQGRGIIPACAGSTLKYLAFLGYSSAFSFGSQGS